MKVTLSVVGKFHTFDLARELARHGALQAIFTGYPRFKLLNENLDADKIHTFPWINTPYMAFPRRDLLGDAIVRQWEYINCTAFDRHTASRMPACDVFVGLSSATLISGRRAKATGARFVCDRGSSHIRTQDELLREEHAEWGLPHRGPDPRFIDREEAEYEEADAITVPSGFSARTFIARGVPVHKVHRLSYGVDITRFHKSSEPDVKHFDVLFAGGASARKGVPYLLQAFKALQHPGKRLFFAGSFSPQFRSHMEARGLWSPQIELLGHLNWDALRDRMSRSHALVLPSIEEGFGLVIPQALACGCPVIAKENTGGPDLFADGEAGYILPIRRADLIADRLQLLADAPLMREQLSQAAQGLVRHIGGWQTYGDQAMAIYQGLLK
jgi:alpha-maltose-1-phosphate synthase